MPKWEEGLRIKNKEHKRMGLSKWTFEQYVDYCPWNTIKVDPEAERHPNTAKSNHYAQERARQMKEHAKKYSVCPSS